MRPCGAGAGECGAHHPHAPAQSMLARVAVQTMDHFIVFHQRGGVEATDGDQRVTAEARECARDQQQCPRMHPCKATDDVADIFVGLKTAEQAGDAAFAANRNDDAARRNEFRLVGESGTERRDRARLEFGVGIHRQDDLGVGLNDRGVERRSLAAVGQSEPAQGGMILRPAQISAGRGFETVALDQHARGAVGRTVVGDQDEVGLVVLLHQGIECARQSRRLVMGCDDHAECRASVGLAWRRQRLTARCPRDHEGHQREFVDDVDDADHPGEHAGEQEGASKRQRKQQGDAQIDGVARERGAPRCQPRRSANECVGQGHHAKFSRPDVGGMPVFCPAAGFAAAAIGPRLVRRHHT
jgi:hypothetical protein